MNKIKKDIESDHGELLTEQEKVIMSGVVQKKTFASYTYSYFILFEGFKMMEIPSYNPKEPKHLDVTPLSQEKAVEAIDELRFKMIADESEWKVRSFELQRWVQAINQ